MPEQQAIEMSRTQLKQRIELNRKAGFGLQAASPAMLNIIFILAERLQLDPLTDITLVHGTPWYTIAGTLKLMRRHPEYAGFRQWPVGPEDKTLGGWAEDDIVWATEIRTRSWGEITQWGKVSQDEIADGQRRKTPIGTNAVEMAQKRSAQHAIRAAFGSDAAPDEVQMGQLIAEELAARQDPATVATNSARYDEIFGTEASLDAEGIPPQEPETEPEVVDPEDVRRARAWSRNQQLGGLAASLKLKPKVLSNRATADEIEAANADLDAQLAEAQVPS